MIDHFLTIDLTDTLWQSDWAGDEIGFPEVEGAIGLYSQRRDDGTYNFYIDYENSKVLDFWKDDDEDEYDYELNESSAPVNLPLELDDFCNRLFKD